MVVLMASECFSMRSMHSTIRRRRFILIEFSRNTNKPISQVWWTLLCDCSTVCAQCCIRCNAISIIDSATSFPICWTAKRMRRRTVTVTITNASANSLHCGQSEYSHIDGESLYCHCTSSICEVDPRSMLYTVRCHWRFDAILYKTPEQLKIREKKKYAFAYVAYAVCEREWVCKCGLNSI